MAQINSFIPDDEIDDEQDNTLSSFIPDEKPFKKAPEALRVDNPEVDRLLAEAKKPFKSLADESVPSFKPETKQKEPSVLSKFSNTVSEFLNAHPRVQEFLTGTSPEFEQRLKQSGITGGVKGPDLMKIPGLEHAVNALSQKISGSQGDLRLGAGAVVQALGGMLEGGFDPRTAGTKLLESVEPSVRQEIPQTSEIPLNLETSDLPIRRAREIPPEFVPVGSEDLFNASRTKSNVVNPEEVLYENAKRKFSTRELENEVPPRNPEQRLEELQRYPGDEAIDIGELPKEEIIPSSLTSQVKESALPQEAKPTATFHSWQEGLPASGELPELPSYPQYDIHGGPFDRSTVSADSLKEKGIDVPETPSFEDYRASRKSGDQLREETFAAKKNKIFNPFEKKVEETSEVPKTFEPDVAENPDEIKTPNLADKATTKLQEIEDSALARIQERGTFKGGRILSGLPIDDMADFSVIGATKIAKGLVKFADWSLEMIKDFGDSIKPYLKQIFEASQKKHAELNLTKEVNPVIQKLNDAIAQGIIKAKEQAKVLTSERGPRIAAAKGVTTKGESGFYEQLGKLKGEYTKLNMPPLRELLTQKDIDGIVDTISRSSIKDEFTKIHAKSGLVKLLNGEIPQQSELDILNAILKTKIEIPGTPTLIKTPSIIRQVYELTRGMMSVDVPFMTSAAFRQGAGLFGTRRWFQAFAESAKSFKSEEIYNKIMDGIENSPVHKQKITLNLKTGKTELKSIADDIGLASSDLKSLTSREEQIRSTLSEKIPLYGRFIRANNRSYTAFLNSLRTHTAEDWLAADNFISGSNTSLDNGKRIANTINELTGHGSLNISEPLSRFTGSKRELQLEKSADALSLVFFSPRLLARDARMMNPLNYIKNDKLVRMKYLEGAIRRAGVWAGFTTLAALSGAEVSNNITSSDFGKARIKNTRADAGTGLLQWIVMMSRQALGESTSSTSGKTQELGSNYTARTRFDVADEFMRNRLHPSLSMGTDLFTASKKKPFYFASEAVERILPMFSSDLHDITKDNPELNQILMGLIAGSASMGSQTYGPKDYGKPEYDIPGDIKFEGGKILGKSNNQKTMSLQQRGITLH